jgi:hypothetical protein
MARPEGPFVAAVERACVDSEARFGWCAAVRRSALARAVFLPLTLKEPYKEKKALRHR